MLSPHDFQIIPKIDSILINIITLCISLAPPKFSYCPSYIATTIITMLSQLTLSHVKFKLLVSLIKARLYAYLYGQLGMYVL